MNPALAQPPVSVVEQTARKKFRRIAWSFVALMILAGSLFAWNTFRSLFTDTRSKVHDSPVVFVIRRDATQNSASWIVDLVLKGANETRSPYKVGRTLPSTFFPWPHAEPPPDTLVVLTRRSLGFAGKIIPDTFHPVVEGRIRTLHLTLPELAALCAKSP